MNMSETFGQRLKAARVMAGLSMDALVKRLGKRLSKSAISKYENGLMMPDSEHLILLADALNVSPDFFFSRSILELSAVNFRKNSSLGKRDVESLIERVRDSIDRYLELESLLDLVEPFENPLEGFIVDSSDAIEEAALKLRSEWGIGVDVAIPHVLDLLEEHSVKVIEIDDMNDFDGVSGKAKGQPFIILNRNRPTDRKRLTALHEFAHQSITFKADIPDAKIEKLCHTFGSAFLMPATILKRELGEKRSEISLPELRALKEQYGISMQAIMYRAKLHGIITEHVYERFSRLISAQGWRKKEPVDYLVPDAPHRFEQLIHRALAEEVISISKAAYLSGKSIQEIEKELVLNDANPHS
uniref:Helix-turn-helix domain-containing protein n=1 Tax=Gracilinema caldarium TaxID=215591 RepID=A0A7C3II91_9SPIR